MLEQRALQPKVLNFVFSLSTVMLDKAAQPSNGFAVLVVVPTFIVVSPLPILIFWRYMHPVNGEPLKVVTLSGIEILINGV